MIKMIAIFGIAFGSLGILFCLIMLVRNKIIFDIRGVALDRADSRANDIIQEGKDPSRWKECFQILESYGSYDSMIWSLRKWSLEALYPDLDRRLEEAGNPNSASKNDLKLTVVK